MKRTILGLVLGLLFGTALMVSGQSGPFSSQIQSALRSFSISPTFTGTVTAINVAMTGTFSANGSTGTTGTVLIGGSPTSWSTGPTIASLVLINTTSPLTAGQATVATTLGSGGTFLTITGGTGGGGTQHATTSVTNGNDTGWIDFGTYGTAGSEKRNAAIHAALTADATTLVTGDLVFYTTNAGSITEKLRVTSAGLIKIKTASTLQSTADKLLTVADATGATGLELNAGTPTLGTCTGGSMTSGSHNSAGEVTGNTSGSCIINFGTPNFTNAPFCTLNDESALIAVQVSARAANTITVTGAASGNSFQWICLGRIGT